MKTKDLIDELQRFADFKMAMKEGGLITNYKKRFEETMTDNPKVMFNQGEGKFAAMDPKDDNLVNKIYNSKDPVKEVDKLVNETKPASSVAEYYKQQSEIKKFNSLDRSTYPSDPKQETD